MSSAAVVIGALRVNNVGYPLTTTYFNNEKHFASQISLYLKDSMLLLVVIFKTLLDE